MKLIIDIEDYIFDTNIDPDWVSVCRDELAESLNNAVRLSDLLQEIRQEMLAIKEGEKQIYGKASWDFTGKCIEIVDDKIEELSE